MKVNGKMGFGLESEKLAANLTETAVGRSEMK